jgi:hypothetical protein
MASVVGVAAKLVNVICFNYMFICGEIRPLTEDFRATAFTIFYGRLIEVPFFGEQYNVIAPLLILVCAIAFAASGLFTYSSKSLEGLAVYADKIEGELRPKKYT